MRHNMLLSISLMFPRKYHQVYLHRVKEKETSKIPAANKLHSLSVSVYSNRLLKNTHVLFAHFGVLNRLFKFLKFHHDLHVGRQTVLTLNVYFALL